ncbi:MAG: hypothetical protein HY049_05235 [Acidobacteria bacterium]|nr:hypothetical protein [Acidobacteriota bacterium]
MDMKRLEALEERIRKAAGLIRSLKEERGALDKRLAEREGEIEDLRARLESAEESGTDAAGIKELAELRAERGEILARVEKMLRMLDDASALAGAEDLLAAIDDAD